LRGYGEADPQTVGGGVGLLHGGEGTHVNTAHSANAPIAIAGNSILVPAGRPNVFGPKGGSPQLVVYTVR
jgi:hypothetical protein